MRDTRSSVRLILTALAAGILLPASSLCAQQAKPEHAAVKPVPRDANWTKRHETFVGIAKKGGVDVLFLGDSITDAWGGEGHNPNANGAKIFAREFEPLKAANFGIGGDQTQHVLWRLQNGELDGIKPRVLMLMIGTNNTGAHSAEEITDGITAIVKEIHKRSPATKVLLLGVFPRDAQPGTPRREKIAKINVAVSKLDDGGKTVKYLDIGKKFLEPDGTLSKEIMYDALHLTEKGYQIWAEAVKGPIMELLKS
jgi:lysophospholipase L1-like esterase